jgi:hypothetical protein
MRTRSARSLRIIACASSRQDHVMCGKTHNCRVANATALFAQTRETLLQAQDRLGPVLGRRSKCLRSIEAGSWGSPRRALSLRSPPVSLHEPKTLLKTWGRSGLTSPFLRRLAVSASSRSTSQVDCSINVVVWDRADESGDSAARVRVSLNPRQTVHIDSAESKSINLQCGDYAETLALVDTSKFVAAGASE